MSSRHRLLAVLAHPDDESLGVGGTLAKCAAEGADVFLITATRGEGGRFRGHPCGDTRHPGRPALGSIRAAELRAAAGELGVREVSLLDYHDQHLDSVPPREAVGRIATQVRAFRPEVVLTFGPDGAYGHPDHIAISQFTTAAIVAAADAAFSPGSDGVLSRPHAVSKLYYLAWPQSETRLSNAISMPSIGASWIACSRAAKPSSRTRWSAAASS
jgi:LmbE family N-acetylglucosaminyl deacetylase